MVTGRAGAPPRVYAALVRAFFALSAILAGCSVQTPPPIPSPDGGGDDAGFDAGLLDAGPPPDAPMTPVDAGPLDPDAACTSATTRAEVERLPVDIIWMVDNSSSMQPAIEEVQRGLNDFAALIGARDLDYRVIMLSLRGRGETTVGGSRRYQVCIPQPLSGDASCGDGPRFFQVSLDVRSTQPLEQFLGTLGQTSGYTSSDDRGSEPWQSLMRPEATKTIVVVTDDNARMVVRSGGGYAPGPGGGRSEGDPVATADWFETFAGGSNPFSSRSLPEGILHARWGGIFEGYTFAGLYGWGSEADDTVRCDYPAGGSPPASGRTYSELVRRTGGVRAKICDGPAAWAPFFDAVASAVERRSRIDCEIPIPEPPMGMFFQRDRINVFLDDGGGSERLGKVPSAGACDARGGWYYDDDDAPGAVILCPDSCAAVQPSEGVTTSVDVQFGCQTVPI